MIPLAVATADPNIRALARLEREDSTGNVGAVLTLTQNPVDAASPPGTSAYVWVVKNGLLLHNIAGADYTVVGNVLTFAVALIAGDKVTVWYYAVAH